MNRLAALAFAGAFLLGCSTVEKAQSETFLAGDSHCVGLAQTTGLKSVARVGAPTGEAVSQLKRIPEGATVILCAGTNDMPARLIGFLPAVNAVLAEAKARKQRLIWVGPISTPLWWDPYSEIATELLSYKLKDFVSMRQWKAGEHDGQFHLTPAGRKVLWDRIKEKL